MPSTHHRFLLPSTTTRVSVTRVLFLFTFSLPDFSSGRNNPYKPGRSGSYQELTIHNTTQWEFCGLFFVTIYTSNSYQSNIFLDFLIFSTLQSALTHNIDLLKQHNATSSTDLYTLYQLSTFMTRGGTSKSSNNITTRVATN